MDTKFRIDLKEKKDKITFPSVPNRGSFFGLFLLQFFFILGVNQNIAKAEDNIRKSPYRSYLKGDLNKLSKAFGGEFSSKVFKSPIKLSTKVAGMGKVSFSIGSLEAPTWERYMTTENGRVRDSSNFLVIKGEAKLTNTGKMEVLGGVLIESNGERKLNLMLPGSRKKRMYHLKADLASLEDGKLQVKVRQRPITSSLGFPCGESASEVVKSIKNKVSEVNHSDGDGHADHEHGHAEVGAIKAFSGNVISISTDADFEYFQRFGSSTNAMIASMVSTLSNIFERDVGVKFVLKDQNVHTSSNSTSTFFSTSPLQMLEEFGDFHTANNHLGEADLYHMFTGRDMDGTTVGVAYVGVACKFPTQSYGISQHFDTAIDAVIFTHEVAHNLNASHDVTNENTIMFPSLSIPGPSSFSNFSINEMQGHMSGLVCKGDAAPAQPTPIPTAIPTAVPTAIPTAIPTAVPTAFVPPPGGGVPTLEPTPIPENPGEDSEPGTEEPEQDFEIFADGRITKKGKFSLVIEPSVFVEGCSVRLVGIASGSDEPFLDIETPIVSEFGIEYRANNRVKAKGSFSLVASLSCGGTVLADNFDDPLVLRMKGKRRRRKFKAEKWIKNFVKRLRVIN